MGKTEVLKRYSYPICLGGLFIIAFLLRAYRIGELPDVVNMDEASLGYNAWCLANYGVDRYLNEWPIYPQNDIGGQSPLYTYCVVLLFKLFPKARLTLELIRIPAIVFSMIAVICTPQMLQMIFGSKRVALAGTTLVTFCPYFIMSGRLALDCDLMLGTSVLAITMLLRYLCKRTWSSLFLCGGSFALVLYTYALSYLILSIFLVTISLYMLYTKKIDFGRLLVLAGEIFVLAIPLILFVACLVLGLSGFRFMGIHILPIGAARVGTLTPAGFWDNVFDCVKITLTNGVLPIDAVEKYYTMYAISIPFIVVGFIWALADFVKSFKSRCFTVSAIFVLYATAIVITIGLAISSGCVYRANAMFVCYLYFCIVGIRQMLHFFHRYRTVFGMVVCVGYVFWMASFVSYYFTAYSVVQLYMYPNSLYFVPEEEALTRVVEEQNVDAVYIDSIVEEFCFFLYPCSPYEKENIDPTGKMRKFYSNVNCNTPIEESAIYMVRKENQEFIMKLQDAGVAYQTEEFTYYYVFILS